MSRKLKLKGAKVAKVANIAKVAKVANMAKVAKVACVPLKPYGGSVVLRRGLLRRAGPDVATKNRRKPVRAPSALTKLCKGTHFCAHLQ